MFAFNRQGLGKLDIVFDKDGVVESCTGTIKIPYDELVYEPVELLDDTFTVASTSISMELKPWCPLFPTATAPQFSLTQTQVDDYGGTVIAYVPKGICHVHIPGLETFSNICKNGESKDQGGGACNLVTKAFLYETHQTADIVIQEAGGCYDFEAGKYTVKDAMRLLQYKNSLWALMLTGAEIVQVLNEAMKKALFEVGFTGSYPYAAGLRYLVNANCKQ